MFNFQDCGHDTFCFEYIQGLPECPICKSKILEWDTIRVASYVNTSVVVTEFDTIIESKDNSSMQTVPAVIVEETSTPAQFPGEDEYSDKDSDDEGGNLHHWCGLDEFKQGGVRTIFLNQDAQVERCALSEETLPEGVVSKSQHYSSSKSYSQVVKEQSTLPSSKESRSELGLKRLHDREDLENLNHTRIVKRKMDDILGLSERTPEVLSTKSVGKVMTQLQVGSKKKPSRPPGRSQGKGSSNPSGRVGTRQI